MAIGIPDPRKIFEALRMQNIYNPTAGPNLETGRGTFTGQPIPTQAPIQQQEPDIMSRFPMETRAQDELHNMLQNFPQRQEPGMLRKIASIAGAFTPEGPKAVDQILYGPYHREMQAFAPRFEAVKEAATQERLANNTLRQIAATTLSNELNVRKQTETERRNEAIEADRTRRTNIAEKRAAAYDFKSRNPNMVFKTREDGQIIAIDPQNPARTIDTGIKSGELSDIDKINLGLDAALQKIAATGTEARKTEGVRQAGREKLVAARAQRAIRGARLSITQDAAAWNLARRQFIADNPGFQEFWDAQGNPLPAAEGDPDYIEALEDIRERYNTIKGRYGSGQLTTESGSNIPENTAPKGTPPIRTIRIRNDLTGQTATMPENKQIPNGWKKIGYVE